MKKIKKLLRMYWEERYTKERMEKTQERRNKDGRQGIDGKKNI